LHKNEIGEGGVIIYDGDKMPGLIGKNLLNVPAERLSKESAGDILMANTVALGAALGLVGYDFALLEELFKGFFSEEIANKNVKAAIAGYQHVQNISSFPKRLNISTATGVCCSMATRRWLLARLLPAVSSCRLTDDTGYFDYGVFRCQK